MATTTMKSTFTLAVREESPGSEAKLSALDRLQASLQERKVDGVRWSQELEDERRAADRQMPSK